MGPCPFPRGGTPAPVRFVGVSPTVSGPVARRLLLLCCWVAAPHTPPLLCPRAPPSPPVPPPPAAAVSLVNSQVLLPSRPFFLSPTPAQSSTWILRHATVPRQAVVIGSPEHFPQRRLGSALYPHPSPSFPLPSTTAAEQKLSAAHTFLPSSGPPPFLPRLRFVSRPQERMVLYITSLPAIHRYIMC